MKRMLFPVMILILISIIGLTACGGSPTPEPTPAPRGDVAAGQELFVTCAACHGPEGEGVPNLGKDMTTSEFIAGKTDDEVVEFIKTGRPPDDPLNTTGVAMLPKGGNPALSDDDLYDIVAYIRTLQQ